MSALSTMIDSIVSTLELAVLAPMARKRTVKSPDPAPEYARKGEAKDQPVPASEPLTVVKVMLEYAPDRYWLMSTENALDFWVKSGMVAQVGGSAVSSPAG